MRKILKSICIGSIILIIIFFAKQSLSSDFSESVSYFAKPPSNISSLINKPTIFHSGSTEIVLDPEKSNESRKRVMWYSLTEETIPYFSHYEVKVNDEIQEEKPEGNDFIYTFDRVGKYDFRIRGVDIHGDKTEFSDTLQFIVKNPQ